MNEHKYRTYEELSQEFRKIYPTLIRAYELVSLMYNLLTANGFPHKEAITKIRDDHKDLPGLVPGMFTGAYHVIIHMFLGELCHRGIKTVLLKPAASLILVRLKIKKTTR
jgi:hypothetical protein